ncbi:MAG: hypothetical protein PHU34_07570 [Candidatus Methanoperedens sp.]|nr:hypothetical protein [Candidatus Methanoperedens sp.]
MTDVNEEFVRIYFEMKGYLVHTNLKYTITKKNIPSESDIDMAIYNLKNDDKAIVEVKGWHSENCTLSYFEDYNDRIYNFIRPEAIQEASKFFKTDKFRKILVISKLGPKRKDECKKIVNQMGIDELIEFNEILKFVIDRVESNKHYRDSEFLQTIRLLKAYNYLK